MDRVDVVDIGASSDSDCEEDGNQHQGSDARGAAPISKAQSMSPLRRSSRYLLYEPAENHADRPANHSSSYIAGHTRSIEINGDIAKSLPPLPAEPCPVPTPARDRSQSVGALPNVVDIEEEDNDAEDIV